MGRNREAKARLRLLGGFEIAGFDGKEIVIPGRKPSALLAILALSPSFSCTRERLIGLLWSDRGDAQARNSLRQALVSLKRALGPHGPEILATDGDRVALVADHLSVDKAGFETLAAEGRAVEAVALYGGPLLGSFHIPERAFEDWVDRERQALAERAIEVHEALLRDAPAGERVVAARRLLSVDPFREASHRWLMRALAAAGERDQALRQYEACRTMLRDEFGVDPEAETVRLYEEIAGQGRPRAGAEPVRAIGPDRKRADRTVVAVLPITDLSGNGEHVVFGDGIAEDLITELARYRHLTVIGHRDSPLYRDERPSLAELRRELAIDFLIEGSIRVAGTHVRLVVHLIDADTGAHVWGDKFDREMGDIFEVQDQIVASVIARLAFSLDEASGSQRDRNPTTSSSAYTCFLKARAAWRDGKEQQAMELAQRAVEIDPAYGRAHAFVSHAHAYSLVSQWKPIDEAETKRLAREAIERALAIDATDPFTLHRAAMTYVLIGEPKTALRFAEAAAGISPQDSEILVIHGMTLACCGRHEEGLAMLERAVELGRRLAPGCHSALSEARHMCRDYAGSLAALDAIVDPPFYFQLGRAANLARLGQAEEARRIVARAPEWFSTALCARSWADCYALPEDQAHWLESFRLAGIEV